MKRCKYTYYGSKNAFVAVCPQMGISQDYRSFGHSIFREVFLEYILLWHVVADIRNQWRLTVTFYNKGFKSDGSAPTRGGDLFLCGIFVHVCN